MSVIEEKCKQKGVRLTEQRRVIAKVMSESKLTFGSKDHPDVDELHKRVTLLRGLYEQNIVTSHQKSCL